MFRPLNNNRRNISVFKYEKPDGVSSKLHYVINLPSSSDFMPLMNYIRRIITRRQSKVLLFYIIYNLLCYSYYAHVMVVPLLSPAGLLFNINVH
jgi:hypothetical protein